MNHGFRLFPESASSMSGEVDAIFFVLVAVGAFFSMLIAGLILYFAIRFRRSPSRRATARPTASAPPPLASGLNDKTGGTARTSLLLEFIWTAGPLAITLGLFAWGSAAYFRMRTPPPDASEVYVVAKQWMWKIEHPGGRREINELHIPIGQPIRLTMVSQDVIHSFYVPAFRVKQDVLPGRYTTLWFQATRPGRFHLFCAEYCGTKHSGMTGYVVALPPAEYQQWLAGNAADQPLEDRGRLAFERLRCDSCHAAGLDVQRGPLLAGRFGQPTQLTDGRTAIFDEAYVRQSILEPRAQLTAGFPPTMPTYAGQVSESDLLAIIAYLKNSRRNG